MSSELFFTPRGRISFAQSLFKAKSINGSEAKFGCSLLFDAAARKTDQWAKMQAAVKAAAEEKFGAKVDKVKWKSPFLDGDESEYEGYAGTVYIRVNSKFKPKFIGRDGNEIGFDEAEDQIYSGVYARASLGVYAYDTTGNKGVAFGLRNIQKLRDGPILGGASSGGREFGAVEDDGEDLDAQFAKDLVG